MLSQHAGSRSVIYSASTSQSLSTLLPSPTFHVDHAPSTLRSQVPSAFPWQQQGLDDFRQIATFLRRIGESKDLLQGRHAHAFLRQRGYDYSTFIGNCLVQMFGNCGSVVDARAAYDVIGKPNVHSWNILIQAYALNGHFEEANTVFGSMPKRDVVSWTAIISWTAQNGFNAEALSHFHRMQSDGIEPNSITFASVLEACSAIEEGFSIHSSIVKKGFDVNVVVATALITMYGDCGSLMHARYIFHAMPEKNVVSWGAIMTAFTQHERAEEALDVFYQMNKEDIALDKVIYLCALSACATLGALKEGHDVHASIIADGLEQDMVVGNALLTMYGKTGDLDSAILMFMKVTKRDTVSWTAIISVCAQNGYSKEAVSLFDLMELQLFQPQIATYVSILDACADILASKKGREAHLAVVKTGNEVDVVVGNSLINFYSKCGSLDEASSVFGSVQAKDIISWNGIILACAQNAQGREALEHFHQMENEGIEPNNVTFMSVIEACMSLGVLNKGRQTHSTLLNSGCEPGATSGSSLISMYGKGGSLREAKTVFERMREQNVVVRNAMLAVSAKDRHEAEALDLFDDQLHHNGVKPNEIATRSPSMCFHNAANLFINGKRNFDVQYMPHHYTCVVDLLGHAGRLAEAEDLLRSITYNTIRASWSSLLCACKLHGDVEHGERAAYRCLELDSDNASPYLELARIYSVAGRWEDAAKARMEFQNCLTRWQPE